MLVQIKAPCSLPLGLARLGPAESDLAWAALTLEYPRIELEAQVKPGQLLISGSRAHIAYRYAERYLAQRGQAPQSEVEIEWAVPSHMGLSADPVLAMSSLWALAWTAGERNPDPVTLAQAAGLAVEDAAAVWGVAQGGLLLVDAAAPAGGWPAVRRRAVIAHAEKDDDWVIVLVLPRPAEGTPADLERQRTAALRAAAPHISAETGSIAQERLFPAMDRDDFAGFADAWRELAALNQAALQAVGAAPALDAEAQAVLEIMRDHGLPVYGQSLTGLALYGLVHGVPASQALRQALRAQIGHFGGTVTVSILSPAGIEVQEEAGTLIPPHKPIQVARPTD